MTPFIHLHVHTQYSLLDGQASVKALVDKAIDNGMPGLALTDHGNMFGAKEFFNYVNKKNGATKKDIKAAEEELASATEQGNETAIAEARDKLEAAKKRILKPIFGCEMYVANKGLHESTDKRDTGRHLIVLAKNEKGYHNLIKLVSQAWMRAFILIRELTSNSFQPAARPDNLFGLPRWRDSPTYKIRTNRGSREASGMVERDFW